ncbi:M20 family metallopeptidase [Allorhodopirellula heiligendammensis]|uniref:Acetylornithine deacetylase n=1 Tax=Allorhodopirellula heiligendammensis TaxID=2714739 RepID=A0A5C6C4C8_9BACT|nr:M20 family metallopeptidase [Allorhodopirellula heiligendammensis]TWU18837.1 Acetylornithine deacetylase [Allorhodopirellula heiligendammensis]
MTRVSDYLSQLIAFDTVSSRSNEGISDLVAAWLQELDFDVERTSYRDSRGVLKCNLVARRGPEMNASGVGDSGRHRADKRSGLAYFCHTDTVPADRWTGPGHNPFIATVEGTRIYGRGACDMKGSLAAMLTSVSQVDPALQTSPLWFVCTADEEVGFEGARHLTEHSACYGQIAAADPPCIIGEPTGLRVIHAHKGIVGFRVVSAGRAAHSSTNTGVNANVAMVPMLQTLLEINERCQTDLVLRNGMFDPPTLTWNFGVSDGMDALNIVPDHCAAWVSFRTMPGVDGSELLAQVQQRAVELGLTFQLFPGGEPMQTPADAACVRDLCELAKPFIGENRSEAVCYATDACVLNGLTQRMVCGPGEIAQAHTVNEFIEVDQLEKGVQLYESAIRHWCV